MYCRWLFIVEAIPTIVLGLLSFIVLPNMPENAGRWLTKEEKHVAIQRTRQSGNTDNKTFDKKQFIAAVVDYKIWLAGKTDLFRGLFLLLTGSIVVIYIGLNVALASFSIFLPTIISDMGFSLLNAQLLTIPPYVVACCLVFVNIHTISLYLKLYFSHIFIVCLMEL